MGCTTSSQSETTANVSTEPPSIHQMQMDSIRKTILQAYQDLDEEICIVESKCPGPRIASNDAWVKILEFRMSQAEKEVVQMPLHLIDDDNVEEMELNYNPQDHINQDIVSVSKVRQLAEKLNIMEDIRRAAQYEEFMAKTCRRYISEFTRMLKTEILLHAKKRSKELFLQYTRLKELYTEQDALIGNITGGVYTSTAEQKLDEELESSRLFRDKLGGVAEQWHTSGNLLRAGAKSAIVAYEKWNLISSSRNVKEKIELTIEALSAITSSVTAFRAAQEILPHVEFTHITQRQIVAVEHASEYLFTDIANVDRYQHTLRVLTVYQESLNESMKWLHDTFKQTLKKDLADAEEIVSAIAKRLRQHRTNYIQVKIGNKLYTRDEY